MLPGWHEQNEDVISEAVSSTDFDVMIRHTTSIKSFGVSRGQAQTSAV